MIPRAFILDVDGVMTDGGFYYSSEGKLFKRFGADDADGLALLKPYLPIRFVTGDKRGFEITKKRIADDMGFPLDLVSTIKRKEWLRDRFELSSLIYMGDGIFDPLVMNSVGYSIAPANADAGARKVANFVTSSGGGNRAVAEAALHILERFFKKFDIFESSNGDVEAAGDWNK